MQQEYRPPHAEHAQSRGKALPLACVSEATYGKERADFLETIYSASFGVFCGERPYSFCAFSRRRYSSNMAAVAVAPQRLTPRLRTWMSASRSRTPPAALTCTFDEQWVRIN